MRNDPQKAGALPCRLGTRCRVPASTDREVGRTEVELAEKADLELG
jgi:hypothetical protein